MKQLMIILAAALALASCTDSLDKVKERQASFDALPARIKDSVYIERYFFTEKDTIPTNAIEQTKRQLKHPESFQYVSSSFHMLGDTGYLVHMDYRAKNLHDSLVIASVDISFAKDGNQSQFKNWTNGMGFPEGIH